MLKNSRSNLGPKTKKMLEHKNFLLQTKKNSFGMYKRSFLKLFEATSWD
jgi:hypothetical protein